MRMLRGSDERELGILIFFPQQLNSRENNYLVKKTNIMLLILCVYIVFS